LKQSGQVEESLAILNKYLPLSKLQAGDEELGLKKIQEEIKDEAADRHGETSR